MFKLISIQPGKNNTHTIINVCGVKLSIKNKEYAKSLKTFKKYAKEFRFIFRFKLVFSIKNLVMRF